MTHHKKGASVRTSALVVGVGVLSSLALAGTSFAAPPNAGSACQTDGKVNGRGATFQKNAADALTAGYELDVCGPVAGGPAEVGTKMSIYNYLASTSRTPKLTGSGNGIKAARCRSDAYAGSDNPYTTTQLTDLRAAPPLPTHADCAPLNDAAAPFTPPFQPTPAPFPDPADTAAPIMSFPVSGGADAVGINLQSSPTCLTPPTTVNLTSANTSALFGGQILNWNDLRLQTDNPELANCDKLVTRVVRLDNSGTTTIFKNYLKNADPNTPLCDPAETWLILSSSANNTNWPEGAVGTCSPLTRGDGNPGVAAAVNATDGAVGYGDLADIRSGAPTAVLAGLRNADNSAFVSPAAGSGSNCSFAGTNQPGNTPNDAVGLNSNVNLTWAQNAVPNRSDVTFRGNGYPACGLTWVLVYTGLNKNTGLPTAISRLNANQRRTLYSYFTYVLSPTAQARLAPAGYAPVPAALVTTLRRGFQASF